MSSRTLVGALALVVLGLLAWELRWVLLVLFGAVVLAVALDVPITAVRRVLRLKRPAALLLVLAVLGLVGSWLIQQLLPELLEQVNQLVELVPVLAQRLAALSRGVSWLPNLEGQLMALGTWERLQPLGGQLLGMAGGAASITVQLLLMGLLAILLALDPRSHQKLVVALTPAIWRAEMRQLLSDCRQALGGWLAGMTISAVSVFLLTPLLLSRTVNLLPTVALTAQLCLGALLGLPGVLLALPLVVVVQVICETVLVQQVMDRWTQR